MKRSPLVIGICGLIGSGKSVVRRALEVMYDCPTFDSDHEAKMLYFAPEIRTEIEGKLGFDPITEGRLDKAALNKCLTVPSQRTQLEMIVHSALESHWAKWYSSQGSDFVVLESAILYTSGYYKHCDTVLRVTAEIETRKRRVLRRDGEGREARFEAIEKMQAEEAKCQKMMAQYVIFNEENRSIVEQLEKIQDSLLSK